MKNSRFVSFLKSDHSVFHTLKKYCSKKSKDLIFIWIPKTGGTSIYNALNESFGMQKRKKYQEFLSFPNKGAITFGHVYYNDLCFLGAVSKDYHCRAYKFCFVRNPYNYAVSLFNHLRKIQLIKNDVDFENFLDDVYLKRPSIGLFNTFGLSQTNPQCDWIFDDKGNLLVDEVFKLEEMENSLKTILDKFNTKTDLSRKYNVSSDKLTFDDFSSNQSIIEKLSVFIAEILMSLITKEFQIGKYLSYLTFLILKISFLKSSLLSLLMAVLIFF